jgi:hypothetical protein
MSYDPENMNRMSSAKRAEAFIPIEDVPDMNPDPREALIRKEEEHETKPAAVIQGNGHVDINDLSRPPSYVSERFEDNQEESDVPPMQSNGFEEGGDDGETIEKVFFDKDKQSPMGAEDRPMTLAKDGKFKVIDSHGKRGREPRYKDKIS